MSDQETVGAPATCVQVAPESEEIKMLPDAPDPPVVTANREPSDEEVTDVIFPERGEFCAAQVAPEFAEIYIWPLLVVAASRLPSAEDATAVQLPLLVRCTQLPATPELVEV